MHTAPDSCPPPDAVPLVVMGESVTVELSGALRGQDRTVRAAWSRCLPPTASPQSPTASPQSFDVSPQSPAAVGAPHDHHDAAPRPSRTGPPAPSADDRPHRFDAAAAQRRAQDPAAPVRRAMDALSTRVTLEGIERCRGRSLMFHAAGLADPVTGGTAVLVAASGTGKTTAACAAGRRLAYVSDETVCVDPADRSITPYPKPLSVVRDVGEPKEQLSPDALGLLPLTRPAHLRSIVLLQRSPGETHPGLTGPLPMVTALSTLVPNISALPSLPHPLLTLLRTIDACGGVRALRYRDIDDVLPDLVRAATVPPEPAGRREPLVHWEPAGTAAPPAVGPAALARHAEPPTTVILGPWVEAVENPEDPSQLLVLLPERLVVLAGVAPVLWHACRERAPLTIRALTRLLVELCGENPDAERLTRESVAHLLSLGVLCPGPETAGTPVR